MPSEEYLRYWPEHCNPKAPETIPARSEVRVIVLHSLAGVAKQTGAPGYTCRLPQLLAACQ